MLKKMLVGGLIGLLGLTPLVSANAEEKSLDDNISVLSSERAVEKKDWSFSGAHYQPLYVSYTIPANSLVVFEGSSSNYLSGAVDVTEFINVTDNLKVASLVSGGQKIYYVQQTLNNFSVSGQMGVMYYVSTTYFTHVSQVTGDSQKPSISGTNNIIVDVDDMLSKNEILSHISAYDDTDGKVDVVFESCDYDPDERVIGEYDAVVSATDRSGNKATANIVIHVVDVTAPVTSGGTNNMSTTYRDKISLEQIKLMVQFKDNYDSEVEVRVVEDNYSDNYTELGGHVVILEAEDSSGNVSEEYGITINVTDPFEPVINGPDSINAKTSHLMTEEEILANFSATDEKDPNVELTLENYSEYASQYAAEIPSTSRVVTVVATDASGNRAEKNVMINVSDDIAPTFEDGTLSYDRSYDAKLSLDDIKGALTFSDNWSGDLTLQVVEDTYSANFNKVGDHKVVINAKDKSGNISENVTVTINVFDHTKPIISAPGTIDAGNNTMVTLEEIKQKISVTDGLDGAITDFTIEGYEAYQESYKVVGQYSLTVKAIDANGNEATATVTIDVKDRIAPEIYFDDYFIILDEGQELTTEQIKSMVSQVLNIEESEIKEIKGEYDTTVAGTYNLEVKTMSNEVFNFKLSVNANYDDETLYRDLAWYEYIYIWFSILFNFQDGYETESFWDFSTRCSYISEVYGSGKLRLPKEEKTESNNVETSVEEVTYRKEEQIGDYAIKF